MLKLENSKGFSVVLSPLGAGVVAVTAPDRSGKLEDVALGYPDQDSYMADGPCMGKIPGRIAGRIAKGQFSLNGKDYQLEINNGPNHLHGGSTGFQNHIWEVVSQSAKEVEFKHISPDGDSGYPAAIEVRAKYSISEDFDLKLEIRSWIIDAEGQRIAAGTPGAESTIINLTNHSYWNLAGHNSGSVLNQQLQLFCSNYLPTDEGLIPVGIAPVKDTPVDFLEPHAMGERIREDFPALNYGKGYDGGWIVDETATQPSCIQAADAPESAWPKLCKGAVITDPESGRRLTVWTNQKAAIVYTGCYLGGCPANKAGRSYDDYDGVAIECQNFPNAINMPEADSPVLAPGQEYRNEMVFSFDCI